MREYLTRIGCDVVFAAKADHPECEHSVAEPPVAFCDALSRIGISRIASYNHADKSSKIIEDAS
jgi:hypothetical protein